METLQDRTVDSSASLPLANLEQRITRAVEVITDLRAQNATLAQKVTLLEQELKGGSTSKQELESHNTQLLKERNEMDVKLKQQAQELAELRAERGEVRTRIEKLLSQLDSLSTS